MGALCLGLCQGCKDSSPLVELVGISFLLRSFEIHGRSPIHPDEYPHRVRIFKVQMLARVCLGSFFFFQMVLLSPE